ncbi:MAG TPA: hypothetical protein VHY84_09800 [Bryobacteraceae bacterium]|jgi:hypothetical protein|nr:hypothetical protein [Bryobacteraceae bacterium]
MKAFTFRLEQALRWRETQVNLRKARVAVAAARLTEIEALREARKTEMLTAAAGIVDGSTGAGLASYAGFREKARAAIRDAEARTVVAQRTLALEMSGLMEARRQLRLLEKLRHAAEIRWQQDFDRELSAFADEAFLSRMQSKLQSKKVRTGA